MKVVIAEEYKRYAKFITDLPTSLSSLKGEILKQKRNSVVKVKCGSKSFVVKKFKRVKGLQPFIYTFFRPTKAERAYLFAAEFRKRGINTPHEIAYLEEKEHGLFRTGYFISEESRGREAFLDLVKKENFDRQLADAITDYIVVMHSKGVLHGDLNSANFLYTHTPEGFSFEMIDVNRSHFTDGFPTRRQCLQNLKRFTHRRDLYEYIIRRYAQKRGWDEESTLADALHLLERFEHRIIK